jgi:tight adherence protein B
MSHGRWPAPAVRRLLLAGLVLGSLGLAGPAAAQQEPLDVALRGEVDTTSKPGHVLATVALSGHDGSRLPSDAFAATFDGRPVTVAGAEPLQATGRQVAVLLAVDTSGSMLAGDNITLAKQAAEQFTANLRPDIKIGVVAFSTKADVVSDLTTDRSQTRAAIAGLRATGDTALRDAVVLGSRLLGRERAQRNLVLLSDGKDDGSQATFQQAVAAAEKAGVVVDTVGLTAPPGAEQDAKALQDLARATGGRALTGVDGADLAALYRRFGGGFASQYVVDIEVPQGSRRKVEFQITVAAGGASDSAGRTLLLGGRSAESTGRGLPELRPAPALSRLESAQGRYVIASLVFVTVLLAGLLLLRPRSRGGRPYRELRQRLSPYSLTHVIADDRRTTAFGSSQLAGRATAMAESLVRRGNLEETFLDRLEAAGLNMRVAEFLLISLGSAFIPPLLVLALTRNLLVTCLVVLLGTVGPFAYLAVRASRRQAKFEEQLPSTLQLLAGALQAGHSLQQAVDTVVHEAGDPIANEFHRVLTEARLGRPLEEAFEAMAKRTRSVDFEWTVMAISLQRQVGGNLAEVLGTVAQTIRDRYSLKRQIRALSAEGRLSSLILTVLPVLMFLALLVFNPEFLAPLYTTTTGLIMLAAAGVLMIVGVFWMKKLTEIKV